jgi:hypothetical protein
MSVLENTKEAVADDKRCFLKGSNEKVIQKKRER